MTFQAQKSAANQKLRSQDGSLDHLQSVFIQLLVKIKTNIGSIEQSSPQSRVGGGGGGGGGDRSIGT